MDKVRNLGPVPLVHPLKPVEDGYQFLKVIAKLGCLLEPKLFRGKLGAFIQATS